MTPGTKTRIAAFPAWAPAAALLAEGVALIPLGLVSPLLEDTLTAELQAVVRQPMQPGHISLWLQPGTGR